jgi:hypothetical protein
VFTGPRVAAEQLRAFNQNLICVGSEDSDRFQVKKAILKTMVNDIVIEVESGRPLRRCQW